MQKGKQYGMDGVHRHFVHNRITGHCNQGQKSKLGGAIVGNGLDRSEQLVAGKLLHVYDINTGRH